LAPRNHNCDFPAREVIVEARPTRQISTDCRFTLSRQATIKLESLGFLNDQFLEIRMLRIENVVPFFDDHRRGYFQYRRRTGVEPALTDFPELRRRIRR